MKRLIRPLYSLWWKILSGRPCSTWISRSGGM